MLIAKLRFRYALMAICRLSLSLSLSSKRCMLVRGCGYVGHDPGYAVKDLPERDTENGRYQTFVKVRATRYELVQRIWIALKAQSAVCAKHLIVFVDI